MNLAKQGAGTDADTQARRKRSKNFTELETRLLIDVIIRHIGTVENKKTDAITWKEKKQIWDKISQDFQTLAGSERSATVLRNKYDAIKQSLKSKLSQNKVEVFKTGGGAADIQELTDFEEKLMGYLELNINGLPAVFDSDNILNGKYCMSTQNYYSLLIFQRTQVVVT